MKPPVTMSRSGLLVEWRVDRHSNRCNTPAIPAADSISTPPRTSLPTEEALNQWDFVPEGKQRVWCNQCEMLSINGVPCHETGCRNEHKVWDPDALPLYQTTREDRQYGEWVDPEPEFEEEMSENLEIGSR
jgi:hypothetical protein